MTRIIMLIALLLVFVGGATVVDAKPVKAAVTAPWQYQLNWPIDTTVNAPVFDIDWNAADTGTTTQLRNVVTTLHAKGSKVVCYVDTGGWEDYRSDAGKYPAVVKGNTVDGWPDERFVDVRRWDILGPILTARFQQCANLGFDAVETDLDDQYPANTGFPLTKMDYVNFDINMANVIHGLGMQWFLKNGITGDNFITLVEPYADATINEQCWQYKECGALAPFRTAGKPIYNVEYAGQQATICPKAVAFPTRTIRKPLSLNKNYSWVCA